MTHVKSLQIRMLDLCNGDYACQPIAVLTVLETLYFFKASESAFVLYKRKIYLELQHLFQQTSECLKL